MLTKMTTHTYFRRIRDEKECTESRNLDLQRVQLQKVMGRPFNQQLLDRVRKLAFLPNATCSVEGTGQLGYPSHYVIFRLSDEDEIQLSFGWPQVQTTDEGTVTVRVMTQSPKLVRQADSVVTKETLTAERRWLDGASVYNLVIH